MRGVFRSSVAVAVASLAGVLCNLWPTFPYATAYILPWSVLTAADKLAAEKAALAATARRKDVARAALAALLRDNAPQAAKDGIAMLRMLVANLVNQPNVPRYRRIATRCACLPVCLPGPFSVVLVGPPHSAHGCIVGKMSRQVWRVLWCLPSPQALVLRTGFSRPT